MTKKATYTPMMKHYLELKEQHEDAIIFYRLGDFYEMFFEDAKTASSELDLVLTGRNAGVEERVPMCGIPHHAAKGYIQRLIQKGYKVAIVEQLEDPALAKTRILAMTANTFDEDRKQALKCGMDGFLSKPIVMEELIRTLQNNMM